MATSIELTLAAKMLGQPIQDLYSSGKDLFSNELAKWRNANSHLQLARKLSRLQKVKTFWQRDKEVSLYTFFYPSPLDFGDSVVKEVAGLSQFPKHGNFVIQGTVGQGKSIFLRHLCAQELKEKGSGRVPVFVELRHVKKDGLGPLIFDALDRLGFEINDKLFDFYAKSGKIVLVLDGFDEIEESMVSAVVDDLERYSEKYEALQIIVSSRPSSAVQNSRHFRIVKLSPLSPSDHPRFLKKIGLSAPESNKLLQAVAASSAAVSGLLTTPLMMTLLVVVYRAENSIPTELPEFYERLFQTLFSKHDSIKPGLPKRHKSGLGERKLQHLFEAFCFAVLQFKKKTTLASGDFSRCFEQATLLSKIESDEDCFKHDISRAVCLLQEEGFDFHFIHKSVLEFFAASFVRGLNNDAAQNFYGQLSGRGWRPWNQVLEFLAQIDKYRYSLYFAIPNLSRGLGQIRVEPDSGDMTNVADSLALALGSIGVSYQADNKGFSVSGSNEENKFLSVLDERMIRHLFESPAANDILLAIGTRKAVAGKNGVDWHKVLMSANTDATQIEFRKHVKEMVELLADFKLYVASEGKLAKMISL